MAACVQTELDRIAHEESRNIEGQLSLFDLGDSVVSGPSIFIPDIPEYPEAQKLGYEKEMVGIYLSGNPLASFTKVMSDVATFDMSEAADIIALSGSDALDDNKQVAMFGMVTDKKTVYTKKKTMMSTISCEDLSGSFEVLLFGKNFDTYNRMVEKNKPYLFIGRRQMREGGELSMFADSCFELTDDPSLLSRIRNDRAYQTALNERSGAQALRQAESFQARPAAVNGNNVQGSGVRQDDVKTPEPRQNGGVPGDGSREPVLRIRYKGKPDSGGFSRLLNFLAYFHGNMAVEIVFDSDQSVSRLDDICRVAPDQAVIDKLAELVGEDNIEIM